MRKIRCEHCVIRGTSLAAGVPDAQPNALRACGTVAISTSQRELIIADAGRLLRIANSDTVGPTGMTAGAQRPRQAPLRPFL